MRPLIETIVFTLGLAWLGFIAAIQATVGFTLETLSYLRRLVIGFEIRWLCYRAKRRYYAIMKSIDSKESKNV